MLKGSGNRILPVLAAVLVSFGLAILLVLLFLRQPDGMQFDEAVTSAEFALESGNQSLMKRELLIASRHAVSARNWRTVLSVAARGIPTDAVPEDYKLFATIAGRSSSALPGDDELRAFWAWSLMRKGNLDNAEKTAEQLRSPKWDSMVSEITLKSVIGASPEDLDNFIALINQENDPEFLESAAHRTGSAELGHDAALLYMYTGRPEEAFGAAVEVMNGSLKWSDPDTPQRRGVQLAMASVAQDYGNRDIAIEWLLSRVNQDRERRALSWEELQFLGDLYWERFLLQGQEGDRSSASKAWKEAQSIVITAVDSGVIPEGAWKIWINQAVLEESRSKIRESRRLLDEALDFYPGKHEVMASWALEMRDDEPALSRRLARIAYEETNNPVLGVTAIILDPESVSPRIYEARLWELFEAATSREEGLHAADSRLIATFLLEYMASRKNYSSIDVAVERYLKIHPDSNWILSWRLAADAARGLGMVNLVPTRIDGDSPYKKMRDEALAEGSWRALHDSAMYSVMTSRELQEAAESLDSRDIASGRSGSFSTDAAILHVLEGLTDRPRIKSQPIGDRLALLLDNRDDTGSDRKKLTLSSKKGITAKADAALALEDRARQLRKEALESIDHAYETAPDLDGPENDLRCREHSRRR